MSEPKFELTGVFSDAAARAEHKPSGEHVLFVEGDENEMDYIVMHPESCSIWVGTEPDPWSGQTVRYHCAVASELEAMGFESMFPDGPSRGYWLLSPWFHRTPSTPSGPADFDAGIEVTQLRLGGHA